MTPKFGVAKQLPTFSTVCLQLPSDVTNLNYNSRLCVKSQTSRVIVNAVIILDLK